MEAVFFYIWGETSNKYQGFRKVGEEKVKFRGIFGDKFAEKSADLAGISREFLGQTSTKSNRQKRADFVVIFMANFARNRSVLG